MKSRIFPILVLALGLLATQANSLDLNLLPYKARGNIAGKLKSVGSDTMAHEMQLWVDGFKQFYPSVEIDIEAKGSNTAPLALLSGEAQLGPMSRQMTPDEMNSFVTKYGYKPTGVLVAVDALAIYVNKNNPINCLSMDQVERIFSADPRSEGGVSATTWGDVGVTGEWASKPIALHSRNSLSGTYKFFRLNVLGGRDFKDNVKMSDGSEGVVSSVGLDPFAIGYSGIGYKTAEVKAVPIRSGASSTCLDPTFENTYTHKYPLARGLYVYLLKNPKAPLDTLSGEFVKYILSSDGQAQAKHGGYYPITRNIREHELTRLGLLASAE